MGEMTNWYTSIAGIAAASVVAGGAVRRWLGDVQGMNSVPLVVYVVLSAIGLSAIAQYVMAVDLAPTFGQLLVQAVTGALVAIGAVGAVTNVAKPLADTVADARKYSWLIVVGLVGLSAAGCATRANGVAVSPEGTAALRANQLVQALRATITPAGTSPIEQLVASKVITAQDAIGVATAIRQTFTYAEDLAAVLKVADQAKDSAERQAGLLKAATLVQAIANGLDNAKLSVVDAKARQSVADILRVASSVLLTVGSMFPAPASVPVGAF